MDFPTVNESAVHLGNVALELESEADVLLVPYWSYFHGIGGHVNGLSPPALKPRNLLYLNKEA